MSATEKHKSQASSRVCTRTKWQNQEVNMSSYLRISLVTLFFVLTSVHATECELTNEYKNARITTYKELNSSYKICRKSTSSAIFWRAVTKCTKEGRGEKIQGGCIHLLEYKNMHTKNDLKHCDILKPTNYLQEFIKKNKTQKCK